jgi:hypothetical protein
MSPELLSTARPTRLRLVGFLALATGAALSGLGATRRWVVLGFPEDRLGAADVPVHGTDVWEGKVVLLGAGVALIGLLAARVSRSDGTRRALALLLIAIGILAIALPVVDAVRADERFGGTGAIDRMVESIAAETELPGDLVREQLAEAFERSLRLELGAGLWITILGGALVAVGGVLTLLWMDDRTRSPRAGPPTAAGERAPAR